MESGRDPYKVLGVARDATNDEIRRAFQALAKEKHPDTNRASGAAADFQAVKEAYDLLRDPGRRKVYDFGSSSRAGVYTSYSDPAEAERLRQRADEFRRRYQNPGESLTHTSVSRATMFAAIYFTHILLTARGSKYDYRGLQEQRRSSGVLWRFWRRCLVHEGLSSSRCLHWCVDLHAFVRPVRCINS